MGKQDYPLSISLPGDDGTARGLGALARQYLLSSLSRGYSPRTIETRLVHLRHFLAWCLERALLWPEQLTRAVLERYLRHLGRTETQRTGKPLAPQGQLLRFSAVRCMLRWAVKTGIIEHNAASDIEHVWPGRTLPRRVLSEQEAERLMSQPAIRFSHGLRDRAMLEVLYCTGLRRAELSWLNVADLDTGRATLLIRKGKGKKERYVPMGVRALWWTSKYLEEARPAMVGMKQQEALFVTKDGERLNIQYLGMLVCKYLKSAELGERGGCHLLRHSCATQMLEGGADIRYIQALLGHARIQSTEIYTHVSVEKLREVHAATHPAERSRSARLLASLAASGEESFELAEELEELQGLEQETPEPEPSAVPPLLAPP